MMPLLFLVIFLFTNYQLDLRKIVGKTRADVEKELGKPTRVELFKPIAEAECLCERVYYLDGKLSVVYYQGKAEWIRVNASVELRNLKCPNVKSFHRGSEYSLISISLNAKESQCCNLIG